MTSITLKKNAVRAARKLLADGKAPAPAFEIKTAAIIGWDIIPAGDNCPSEAKAAAPRLNSGKPTRSKRTANARPGGSLLVQFWAPPKSRSPSRRSNSLSAFKLHRVRPAE